ncbi:hypothetical protein PINS_up010893 [Pythium insidiosum]|nr:hypothetical protein PINS_up010893 [Pythium insidiosum]
MSELDDLFPDMAGVFATQESAMDNALAVLTQQLQHLATDNATHVHALQTLHRSQQQLLDSQQQLQRVIAGLQSTTKTQAAELDALRTTMHESRPDLSSLQASLERQAESIVVRHLQSMEMRLTQKVDERLLETSHRAYLQAQQTEEAMRLQLELLEKKFEYLSRVKMEIKDVTKRIEKQDQEIDDMRTSLALLVKSVGTDEIDDDEDEDDDDQRNGGRMSAVSTACEPPPEPTPILVEEVTEPLLPSISEAQSVGDIVEEEAEQPSPTQDAAAVEAEQIVVEAEPVEEAQLIAEPDPVQDPPEETPSAPDEIHTEESRSDQPAPEPEQPTPATEVMTETSAPSDPIEPPPVEQVVDEPQVETTAPEPEETDMKPAAIEEEPAPDSSDSESSDDNEGYDNVASMADAATRQPVLIHHMATVPNLSAVSFRRFTLALRRALDYLLTNLSSRSAISSPGAISKAPRCCAEGAK